jgi:mRNA interferase RelE/StbE
VTVALTDAALDDLRRAGPVAAALLLGRLRVLEQDPEVGVPLVDRRTGFRVLDALDGDARVVFDADADGGRVTVREIWIDGVRSDGEAYAEALERVRGADPSEQVTLARSVQRLARLTGVRPVPSERLRPPVPDWLADPLVREARFDRLAVTAMDATTAFDAWNRFVDDRNATPTPPGTPATAPGSP